MWSLNCKIIFSRCHDILLAHQTWSDVDPFPLLESISAQQCPCLQILSWTAPCAVLDSKFPGSILTAHGQRLGWGSHHLKGSSQRRTELSPKLPDTLSVLSADTEEDIFRIHTESVSGQCSCAQNHCYPCLDFSRYQNGKTFTVSHTYCCFCERENYLHRSIIAFSPTALHPYPVP